MSNIHFLTACSRPDNLLKIKDNLLQLNNNLHQITWHICCDIKKVGKDLIWGSGLWQSLDENWIRFYEASSYFPMPEYGFSQLNFILMHFRLGLFKGYVYVLDDDNLVPSNFLNYDYNEADSLVYLFRQKFYGPSQGYESVLQLRDNNNPKIDYIDQAQIMWHSKIDKIFNLQKNSDGILIEEICRENSYRRLSRPIVYYNRLKWSEYATFPGFDENYYLSNYPDVASAVKEKIFLNGLEHFLQYGRAEGRKMREEMFDKEYYLENNPDVKTDGYIHFLKIGYLENRRHRWVKPT